MLMKSIFICAVTVMSYVVTVTFDEVPDFEFEDSYPTMHHSQSRKESSLTSLDYLNEFFIDDGTTNEPEHDIANKNRLLKEAMFKALAARDLRFKFSEVMPLFRALSKSQRMVFASIISAQMNGGKPLTLEQVKQMFGESRADNRALLLPIVYDLANLVREGFLRSDKHKEHEKGDQNQFLRRSFNNIEQRAHKKSNVTAIKEIDFSAPASLISDSTFHVDDHDEPKIKDINLEENFDALTPEAYVQIEKKSLELITTPKSMPFTLSRIHPAPAKNLTRDEIENLALSGLNGTTQNTLTDVNGTDISPMALIGRNRKRPVGGPNPEACERFTGGLCLQVKNYPINEIMGSIRRHRHAMEALLAEYRDKDKELEQLDYLGDPTGDLSDLRRRQDSDGTSVPGAMCNSIIRYARPQKARSATGDWKFIVNTGEHTQTLRLEKCSQPLEPCSYLTENFESSCTQVYNYHRLLSWDNMRGLHVDIFKVPTCCSCHLVGYKEAFPPLASPSNSLLAAASGTRNRLKDFDEYSASSNRNSQYSTLSINGSEDDETNDDEDSNIAYQFGNGFKRLNPRKKTPTILEATDSPKTRFTTNRSPIFPESYLTPPANGRDANFPFGPRPPRDRQRTQSLKRKQSDRSDQNYAESDLKISHVTVFPPKIFSPSERPRKITPPISSTIDTNSVNIRLQNAHSADNRRVNYNYHPIIDFFEDDDPPQNVIDRKSGKLVANQESWRPVIGG